MTGNRALGDFLRSRRTRLNADETSLPGRQRRRTPGLKREEVAQRAGISSEWYIKLEQGRAVSPSTETVEALGRALALDEAELAHLRALAAAGGRRGFRRPPVPDALRRLVAALPEPAYLVARNLDVLAWNHAALSLFGEFAQATDEDRNILHWMLTEPSARQVFGLGWAEEARRVVALFRAEHDLWPGEAAFTAQVERVQARSPEFDGWWSEHSVRAPLSGTKQLHHQTLGVVHYDHASFQANDDPALRLVIYTRRY